MCSGWTTPRPVSTSGSVLWNIMLSLGSEGQFRRTLPGLDLYAWDHVSDTGKIVGEQKDKVLIRFFSRVG